jgi:acyl-CoA synthetase (AMP-forming)/AMP-acid ligase II
MAGTEPRHFVEIVRRRAAERGDACAYRFVRNDVELETLTFAGLDRDARCVARALEGRAGDRALLLFPPGLAFVRAFIGCWFAAVVPVPCAPPARKQEVSRVVRIARDAGITIIVSASGVDDVLRAELERAGLSGIVYLTTETLLDGADAPWSEPRLSDDAVALLQYTSGSTGDPKGVVVSHGNLLHNERTIQRLFEHDEGARGVGWLPLHHDMGLIGHVLQPLYVGFESTLMSPVAFVMRPLSWLRAISKYRATTSGGPNFAYQLCADAATPAAMADLDLSTWTVAFVGAEPIRRRTLERFTEVFAPCGFRPEAFNTCYGLAEATLLVSGARKHERPVVVDYDSGALAMHRARRSQGAADSISLVSCGSVAPDLVAIIVDPHTRRPLDDGEVGEIWVSGRNVAQGYWRRPDLTEEVFRASIEGVDGTWLRTGDLGFFEQGDLYVAGRLKDLLIVRGRNHHPQDVEQTCWQSHSSLRAGRAAAFMVEVDGDERLVIAQEVDGEVLRGNEALDVADVTCRVRAGIAETHGLTLHSLVLVRRGQIPMTSSGKVRRRECRRLYLEEGLKIFGPEN